MENYIKVIANIFVLKKKSNSRQHLFFKRFRLQILEFRWFLGRGRVAARGLYSYYVSHWVTESVSPKILQISTSFQSWISLGSDDRIGSIFFPGSVCVSSTWVSTCPTCTWTRARAVLWRHVPKKVKKPNFLNFCRRKKLNTKIWGRRKF